MAPPFANKKLKNHLIDVKSSLLESVTVWKLLLYKQLILVCYITLYMFFRFLPSPS